ncbi:MAG: FAD-dependent oxidoreductase [Armatimonadota bacterium]|nr:FAD-dependent oxidoreductase [Armatimonadota bacterium]
MELTVRHGAVVQPRCEVPVFAEVDVLVVGGGPAGWSAATAAARRGAGTMLVEQYGFLGGMMTAGGVGCLCGPYTCAPGSTEKQIVFGLCGEFMRRLEAADAGFKYRHRFQVDHHRAKVVLDELIVEAGVRPLYHTMCVDALIDGGAIRGVMIENKAGRQAVLAQVVIDATGDGDVAARAGVPYHKGDDDGLLQGPTYIFDMAGVDVERAMAVPLADLRALMEDATRSGAWSLPRVSGSYSPLPQPGTVHVNMTRVYRVDATDPESLTRADIEGRRLAVLYAEFLRARVPGFEHAYLAGLAPQIGIRETRRIIGDYVLTGDDVLSARKFDDAVCNAAWPIELHDPAGPDTRRVHLRGDEYYQIPYRCLVPLRVEQLLVAGRCLSSTREGNGSARVMAYAMAMGEAAGAAAVMALSAGCSVREVDARALRAELERAGVVLA